jgi:hypothetical protein
MATLTYVDHVAVNELALNHRLGSALTGVTVMSGSTVLSLSLESLSSYFEGAPLPANSYGFDDYRVLVFLSTPTVLTVILTYTSTDLDHFTTEDNYILTTEDNNDLSLES